MHLFGGEEVADDVLRESLKILFLVGLDALAAVDAETGVPLVSEHFGALERKKALSNE